MEIRHAGIPSRGGEHTPRHRKRRIESHGLLEELNGLRRIRLHVNSAFEDAQPNVRRDGLEIFFSSNRTGTVGMADIYSATRARTSDPWSTPVNLGSNVNSGAAETRPSLSWDGTTLYFGSTRPGVEGVSDIYVTTRQRLGGGS